MQVQTIQSNNYNAPNFGALQITKEGRKLIKSWSGRANVWRHINTWKKELAATKYFDLQFDGLCKNLFPIIKSKNPYYTYNCEAPLRVSDEPKGKHLWVAGTDLIDCGDWVGYPLKFKTKEDAENAYNTLKKHQHGNSMTTIEKMQWTVDSVKILEQAFENMYGIKIFKNWGPSTASETKNTKLPFMQRLKNAWQALKG